MPISVKPYIRFVMKTFTTVCAGLFMLLMNTQPLLLQAQPTGRIVINEYLPWPGNGCGVTTEFIELVNLGPGIVDLSCYVVTDGDYAITIPSGTFLNPGQYFVLAGQSFIPAPCGNLLQPIYADLNWNTCNCTSGPIPTTGDGLMTDGGSANEQLVLLNPSGQVVDAVVRGLPQETSASIITLNAPSCPGFTFDLDLMPIKYETIGESTGRSNSMARKLDGDCGWVKDTQQSGGASNNTSGDYSPFSLSMYITQGLDCTGGNARFVVDQQPSSNWFPLQYLLAYDVDGDGMFGPGDTFTNGSDSSAPDLILPNLPLGFYSILIGPQQECSYQSFVFSIGPCGTLSFTLTGFTVESFGAGVLIRASITGASQLKTIHIEGSDDGKEFIPVKMLPFAPQPDKQTLEQTLPDAPFRYYRLVLTNEQQRMVYSPVQAVRSGRSSTIFRLLRNPVEDVILLQYDAQLPTQLKIELLDMMGAHKGRFSLPSARHIRIPATQLTKGIYILRIQTNQGQVQTFRVVKN